MASTCPPNGVINLYNLYVGGVLSFSGLNTSGHSGIQWSQPSGYSHWPLPRHSLLLQSGGLQCPPRESSPDGVPFPNVTIINATALAIVWSTPLVPNGIVTGYVVLQTNIPVCYCVQSRYVMSSSSPSFPQHQMDLMLCRCRMWAPPT